MLMARLPRKYCAKLQELRLERGSQRESVSASASTSTRARRICKGRTGPSAQLSLPACNLATGEGGKKRISFSIKQQQ